MNAEFQFNAWERKPSCRFAIEKESLGTEHIAALMICLTHCNYPGKASRWDNCLLQVSSREPIGMWFIENSVAAWGLSASWHALPLWALYPIVIDCS